VFRHGELAGIEPAARQGTLADGDRLGYDYLIVATGVAAAHHGIPGAAEYALGLYTRRDAIALRDRITAELDQISCVGDRCDVTVTVIGGAATGVELTGTLADRATGATGTDPDGTRPRLIHAPVQQHTERTTS